MYYTKKELHDRCLGKKMSELSRDEQILLIVDSQPYVGDGEYPYINCDCMVYFWGTGLCVPGTFKDGEDYPNVDVPLQECTVDVKLPF